MKKPPEAPQTSPPSSTTPSTQNAAPNPFTGMAEESQDYFSKAVLKNAKRLRTRVYVANSPIHGKGLFAAKSLKANKVVGRLHGMLTDKEGTYVLWLEKNLGLEITNELRFINHSSDPNCELTDLDVVTLRPIAEDEELTHDYGW